MQEEVNDLQTENEKLTDKINALESKFLSNS